MTTFCTIVLTYLTLHPDGSKSFMVDYLSKPQYEARISEMRRACKDPDNCTQYTQERSLKYEAPFPCKEDVEVEL